MNLLTRLQTYIQDALYILPVVIISLTFHEFSHGYIAYKLGDPTAKYEGRLTLNPLKHIDPIGFIMMFIIHFGWAKPVPVNPMYFKNPKKGMMLTAIAGPVSNLLLAFVGSFFAMFFNYKILFSSFVIYEILFKFFMLFTFLNIGLAIFNLIPVYPLDGSRILGYFLPDSFNNFFIKYGNYIYLIFALLVIFTDYVQGGIYIVQSSVYRLFVMIWRYPVISLAKMF